LMTATATAAANSSLYTCLKVHRKGPVSINPARARTEIRETQPAFTGAQLSQVEQEVFNETIHAVSATNIRKTMGLK
jgi:hypothetical protein